MIDPWKTRVKALLQSRSKTNATLPCARRKVPQRLLLGVRVHRPSGVRSVARRHPPGRQHDGRSAKISAKCCSFSAVSALIFARKYAFFSIFQNLPDYPLEHLKFWKYGKISAKCCSFSAVSAPIFARKYAFCSIFQNLPDSQAEIFEI